MAEEIGTESRHYVEKGALADVSAIFGMHIWATLESGTVNIDDGPRMASSDRFVIKIHGRSAHGSAPDQAKTPSSLPQPSSWACRPYRAA